MKFCQSCGMPLTILYILLPDYAAHEVVYLAQAIASDEYALKENPKIVRDAIARGKIVGAICNAASFMAKCGFLNTVRHAGTHRNVLSVQQTGILQPVP